MEITRNGDLLYGINLKKPIYIIGVGAVGSFVATTLARTGFANLHIADFDKVEAHNISNQAFNHEHIDQLKVDACEDLCLKINPECKVTKYPKGLDLEKPLDIIGSDGIVMVCVDTMEGRRSIYNALKYKERKILECRMDFKSFQLYWCVTPNKNYEDMLNIEGSVPLSACGSPVSIAFTSQSLACFMVAKMIDFSNEEETDDTGGELLVSLSPFQMLDNIWRIK